MIVNRAAHAYRRMDRLRLLVLLLVTATSVVIVQVLTSPSGSAFEDTGPPSNPGSVGSAADPHEIATVEDLRWMRDRANSVDETNDAGAWSRDRYFRQTQNINLAGETNWVPMGTSNRPFRGFYDGQFYEIQNLTIDATLGVDDERRYGLFGRVRSASGSPRPAVQNLRLADVNISVHDNVGGNLRVGALAGQVGADGSPRQDIRIEQVSVTGTVGARFTGAGELYVAGVVGQTEHRSFLDNRISFRGDIDLELDGVTGTSRANVGGLVARTSQDSEVSRAYAQACISVTGSVPTTRLLDVGLTIGSTSGNPSTIEEMYGALLREAECDRASSVDRVNFGVVGYVEWTADEVIEVYHPSGVEAFGRRVGVQTLDFIARDETAMRGASAAESMTGTDGRWDFSRVWSVVDEPFDDYPVFYWETVAAGTAAPGAPGGPTVSMQGRRATVTWGVADDGGDANLTYDLTVSAEGQDDAACVRRHTEELSCVFDDLVVDTAYTFSVTASNVAGTGPAATAVATPRRPDTPVLSVAEGNGQLLLSFDPGPQATNVAYRIRAQADDDWTDDEQGWVERSPASLSMPWTVTGLQNGTTYVAQVRVLAPGTTSPPSDPVTAKPSAPPPPAPAPAPAPDPEPEPVPVREPIRDGSGRLPAPGDAQVVVDGAPQTVTVAPTPTGGMAVTGDGFQIEVAPEDANGNGTGNGNGNGNGDGPATPPDGSPEADEDEDVSARADLTFTRGRGAQVRVSGFAPSSPVRLWLFSEPRLLGDFETSGAGALEALTEIIPDDVDACLHTLHAEGTLPGGREVTLSLGVWIDADPYPFGDVGEDNVHRRAIGCLYDRQLVRGVGAGAFDPEGRATRGQLSSVFAAWFDLEPSAGASSSLTDVAGSTHERAILALLEAGVVEGLADGSFGARQAMTRGQFASVLAGLLNLDTDAAVASFPDAGAAHGGAIGALEEAEMVSGFGDGSFRPHAPISRAQASSMIVRALIATE